MFICIGIEWKENGESKSMAAEGFVDWAAILVDQYQSIKSGLNMWNRNGFEKG